MCLKSLTCCVCSNLSCTKVFAHHYHALVDLRVQLRCTADDETEADESLCKITDNCCHGDAPVGRPKMPRAKKKRARQKGREREICYHWRADCLKRLSNILWESKSTRQHLFLTVTSF